MIMIFSLQNLITDLAANNDRIKRINKMGDTMIAEGHSGKPAIRKRQKEINDRYFILIIFYY